MFSMIPASVVREPLVVVVDAALDNVEERLLDVCGHGSTTPISDWRIVDGADGRHLGGGAGEKELVSGVQLSSRDGSLIMDGVAALVGQRDHRIAGDPFEDRLCRASRVNL